MRTGAGSGEESCADCKAVGIGALYFPNEEAPGMYAEYLARPVS